MLEQTIIALAMSVKQEGSDSPTLKASSFISYSKKPFCFRRTVRLVVLHLVCTPNSYQQFQKFSSFLVGWLVWWFKSSESLLQVAVAKQRTISKTRVLSSLLVKDDPCGDISR